MSDACRDWATADLEEGRRHSYVFPLVEEVERQQSDLFERFLKLAYLYDPEDCIVRRQFSAPMVPRDNLVSENVIASNVDTVTAVIAATEVRARMMTDGAEWSEQRRAVHLEWYAEGMGKRLRLAQLCPLAFRDASLKGTGLLKIWPDAEQGDVCIERVLVDDIIVDEAEVRAGKPRQLHQRRIVAKDDLIAQFPEHEEAIKNAGAARGSLGARRWWAGYRQFARYEVVVIESWMLPHGGRPGRRCICIESADLLDEEWTKTRFPFARIAWSDRLEGWYGIGLGERMIGHQRQLNKQNWVIDASQDQVARPTTYVRQADANLRVQTINAVGTVVPYKAQKPETVIPQAVSPEIYARREVIKGSAYEESGLSRLAATAQKPAGLDSAVAMREYRDATTQRFATQEKAYEAFVLDVVWLILEACKELGESAPVIVRKSRFGRKKLDWADVDMGDVQVQLAAASTLSRTPAGRVQTVLELAQTGMISMDEARRLMRHPDLERELSLYTAAIEDIEACIEEILDGGQVVPEPYQHLAMGITRFQRAYLKARRDGAPEEVLETIRQWIVQASFLLDQQQPAMAPEGAPMAPPTAPQPGPIPTAPAMPA